MGKRKGWGDERERETQFLTVQLNRLAFTLYAIRREWGGGGGGREERERRERENERETEGISFYGTVQYTSFCIIRPDRIQMIWERERGGG